ncbi:Uncharacterised protein [Mycobacteroides abscessus]|nr:Uncharacterised protein [Mycobacteroides abscessus]
MTTPVTPAASAVSPIATPRCADGSRLAPPSGSTSTCTSCGRTRTPPRRVTGPRKPMTKSFAGRS